MDPGFHVRSGEGRHLGASFYLHVFPFQKIFVDDLNEGRGVHVVHVVVETECSEASEHKQFLLLWSILCFSSLESSCHIFISLSLYIVFILVN